MPARKYTISMGGNDGWTLQAASIGGFRFVRPVGDEEATRLVEAAASLRRAVAASPFRLILSASDAWQGALAAASTPNAAAALPLHADHLLERLVAWCLLWRMVADQTAHYLSAQFGDESTQFSMFRASQSSAYDHRRGYRLAEAMRNMVQHQEMPPLKTSYEMGLDEQRKQIQHLSIRVRATWFLDSPKCPRSVKDELEPLRDDDLDVIEMVKDAMVGLESVFQTTVAFVSATVKDDLQAITALASEVRPDMPLLLRVDGAIAKGPNINMQRFDDLLIRLGWTSPG